jgi:hypothetical protein
MQTLATLALRPLLDAACKAVGAAPGGGAAEGVVRFLTDRFTDHSRRLGDALNRAVERAWSALELALAGDSWWERVKGALGRGEDRALRDQIRAFLDATPLGGLPGHGPEFRTLALRELRAARSAGLLKLAGLEPRPLAEGVAGFLRHAAPDKMLQAEADALAGAGGELRQAGHPALAQLLTVRAGDSGSLLTVAVRYFFRREVEADPELFRGLTFAQMENLGQAQERGFAALADALSRHGQELSDLLGDVHETVTQTHAAVHDLKDELRRVGQAVQVALETQTLARPVDDQAGRSEEDLRLGLMNSLLKTPHRRLDELWPLHQNLVARDPRFYVQLAAWYHDKGDVRDHKEMFLIALSLSDFEGHRDVGLALLRGLPPYQVLRVLDFIHGTARRLRVPPRVVQEGDRKKTVAAHEEVIKTGLGRNLPRSLRTEVVRYLREREASPEWFDATALVARKALKRLYALLHVAPSERAQQTLFDDKPPPDSRLASLKRLAKATTPAEQVRALAEARVPFRVAITLLPERTPALWELLIDRMSPQEVVNNVGLMQRHGVLDNKDLKALVDLKLEEARTDKRVSALKADRALAAVDAPADVRDKLAKVADDQIKARGRIRRATALLVDKSGSMELAIEVGKRLGAMISAVCEKELYAYAFDKLAYAIEPKGRDLAAWQKAFAGLTANGMTSCGVALEMMRRRKQRVEQIILVTDEEEYDPPFFVDSLQKYRRDLAADPTVCIVRVPDSSTRLQDQCRRAGIAVTTFDFAGDYYSLPNLIPLLEPPSEMDLLLEIMEYPLPQRRQA